MEGAADVRLADNEIKLVALLAKHFRPTQCVGVDLSSHQIGYAKAKFEGIHNL